MHLRSIAINLVFNIVLPLIAVNALEAHGVKVVEALVISAVFPAIETGFAWNRRRRLDALGAIVLSFITLGAVTSLISGDVHFALAKESFFTATFGLIALASLLRPRPLQFYFGRTFVAAGDPVKEAAWDARWSDAGFRTVMRRMTAVWGVTYLAEAVVRAILVYELPVNAALVVSPLLATGVTFALIYWTIRYGKAAERRGVERRAGAAAAVPAQVTAALG
jgi:branched-subunit amino acid transport protein